MVSIPLLVGTALTGGALADSGPMLGEREPCGTVPLLEELMATPRMPADYEAPPPGPEKGTRDAYSVPNEHSSENFVMRWGNSVTWSEEQATSWLNIFEDAWEVEINEMGHDAPRTADDYKINIYVGNSGGGAPEISGAAGYFTSDSRGYPMIVMSPNTLADIPNGRLTAAHEFYHAVQWGTESYSYSGDAAWYWEATASWVEVMVYPDDVDYAGFLAGFAFLPHYALNFFDYPDSGSLQEYHQYGAFIFPRYLEEHVGSWELVRDSWMDPVSSDPLDTIEAGVEDLGLDMHDVLIEFAARNAYWDYEHGSDYKDILEEWEDRYPSEDFQVAAEISRSGTTDWEEVDEEVLPERYGYNLLRLHKPYDGRLRFAFEGDTNSTGGRKANWLARVVVVADGTRDYQEVAFDGGVADHDIGDVSDATSVTVVVMPTMNRYVEGDVVPYRFQLEFTEGGDSEDSPSEGGLVQYDYDDDEGKGCGCSATPSPGRHLGWLALLAPLVVGRRRR